MNQKQINLEKKKLKKCIDIMVKPYGTYIWKYNKDNEMVALWKSKYYYQGIQIKVFGFSDKKKPYSGQTMVLTSLCLEDLVSLYEKVLELYNKGRLGPCITK